MKSHITRWEGQPLYLVVWRGGTTDKRESPLFLEVECFPDGEHEIEISPFGWGSWLAVFDSEEEAIKIAQRFKGRVIELREAVKK